MFETFSKLHDRLSKMQFERIFEISTNIANSINPYCSSFHIITNLFMTEKITNVICIAVKLRINQKFSCSQPITVKLFSRSTVIDVLEFHGRIHFTQI